MNRRMVMTLLAVAGVFISAYLYLYKVGAIGTLACGSGACETVQMSPQSRFMGVEVALIGLVGYVVLLGFSLASLQPRFAGRSIPVVALAVLSVGALGFTLYLKYLEFFVIHAICRWCVGSAAIVLLFTVLALVEYRRSDPAVDA